MAVYQWPTYLWVDPSFALGGVGLLPFMHSFAKAYLVDFLREHLLFQKEDF